jgi:hypothetical protein
VSSSTHLSHVVFTKQDYLYYTKILWTERNEYLVQYSVLYGVGIVFVRHGTLLRQEYGQLIYAYNRRCQEYCSSVLVDTILFAQYDIYLHESKYIYCLDAYLALAIHFV